MSLNFEFIVKDPRWDAEELSEIGARVAVVLSDYLTFPDMASAIVMACDNTTISNLNQNFRGKLQPTNVLSWPSVDRSAPHPGGWPALPRAEETSELGDIALAYETCHREAAQAGCLLSDHVLHLFVHGILHLLGYDHIDDQDAMIMERIEVEILSALGVVNPYNDRGGMPSILER